MYLHDLTCCFSVTSAGRLSTNPTLFGLTWSKPVTSPGPTPSASCVRKGAPGSQTSGLTTRPSTSTSNHTSVPCVTSQPQTPPPFWLTPRMCTIWRPIGSSPSSLRSSNWRSMRESLVLFACRREKGEPCSQLMSRKWLTKCTQLTKEHWLIQDFTLEETKRLPV